MTSDRAERFYMVRTVDRNSGVAAGWLGRDSAVGDPEELVGRVEHTCDDFLFELAADLSDSGTVGVEMGSSSHDAIAKASGGIDHERLSDASGVVNDLHIITLPQEIAYHGQYAAVADLAMEAVRAGVRPGRREADAATDVTAALISELPDTPGDWPPYAVTTSGRQFVCPHAAMER
ncbi:hypothetical protein [Mesorhizobium sp.]|uniref:hypothetical protein n=1 Tax=Mesorhizobium sp. TaxID=1871066 RepID=UPI000FE44219|nr:hypothetical protein [Mesorhizobium sp.]RWN48877.1 MAG: hypothetical protein EOR98_34350 [Mesorhizobium sp.]RWN69009.1 MAG: hypothetical protein EOS01_34605 [Mesorhizobium sp.]RWN69589.1 MAG: hypothetical protein EOS02_34395 [Mesorhizobium sp.]RWN81230.1 MAG: hypothetical protein EOS04_34310 [Mesorhizobium sp.]RWO05757.1 MAG: hypothetical protein EOS15_34755 [Mesorhizobium sp.]